MAVSDPIVPRDAAAADRPISVVFCWAEVTGYMAACWQALARRPGIDLHILHTRQIHDTVKNPFDLEPLLGGLSHEMFDGTRADIDEWLLAVVRRHRPDVVVLCGWIFWPYTRLPQAPELAPVRFVLGMDSPWSGTLRQRLGRLRLAPVIKRMSAVITAGERSDEYARRLGVPQNRLHHGYYGFDQSPLAGLGAARRAGGAWPRRFLFVGRYVPQKDLATLVAAYRAYCGMVEEPWGLTCCGSGPDGHLLDGVPGLVNAGFTQPAELVGRFRDHGAFVIASTFEPWGVVLAEAAGSGLPVVCTTACGAGLDIVRSYYNGLITPPGDVDALARAMRWIHEHEAELPEMGERGRALADAFSATSWASRWHNLLLAVVANPE